jgi:uncharacterized protein
LNTNIARVVVESIRTCNLHCKYCFPEQMWDREGRGGAMQENIYHNILETVCKNTQRSDIAIHFAGGEPLLAGLKWFEKIFAVSDDISKKYDKKFSYTLQTNATLINTKFLEIFKKNKVIVGVSIDGPPLINDVTRGQSNLVINGLREIIEYLGYTPGVIVVVSKMNVDNIAEVIDFLNKFGIRTFRANLMGADTPTNSQFVPTVKQWIRCQQIICEKMISHKGRLLEDNIITKIVKFVRCLKENISPFTHSLNSCADEFCAAGEKLLFFDNEGTAYPCPRAVTNKTNCIGNIRTSNFYDEHDRMKPKLRAEMKLQSSCLTCPARISCDYGCHAWNNGRFFEIVCDSTKQLFIWFSKNLEMVSKLYIYAYNRQIKRLNKKHMNEIHDISETTITNFSRSLDRSLRNYSLSKDYRMETLSEHYCS